MDIKEVRVDVMVQREDSLVKKIHIFYISIVHIYLLTFSSGHFIEAVIYDRFPEKIIILML